MKKQVREVALDLLLHIEKKRAYSNLLLDQTIRRARLSERDAALLTEIVYGTVQRKMTLDFFLSRFVKKGLSSLEDWVKELLRLSVYQLVYLDRIPEHAVVHEAVTIAKKRGHKGSSGMVNGVLRSIIREGVPAFDTIADETEKLAVETSVPEWLVKRWSDEYGFATTKAICFASLERPHVTVRVNRLKATVDEVMALLEKEGLTVERGTLSCDAIIIKKGNVFQTDVYARGYVTAQDESSMLVARAVGAKSGMTILDACAAPGGKTTHLAERMDGKGKVIALDIHPHKVKLIEQQKQRLQLDNIETNVLDSRQLHSGTFGMTFDRVLVDAPCSGLGVIRRKPDIKWSKTEADIRAIVNVQREILDAVAPLVKRGGKLVYSTCTLSREENEDMVRSFLARHPEFSPDPTLSERLPEKVNVASGIVTIFPQDFKTDGFFISCFTKD